MIERFDLQDETNGKRVRPLPCETLIPYERHCVRAESSLACRGVFKRCHHVFSASWSGLFLLRTSTPSPLRSQTLLNGFSTAWTLEVNNFCSTPSLHKFTRVHQRPSRHELRSFSSLPIRRCPELSIRYCSVRLSPRYVRFHYVCPDPRSFRVSLSGNGPPCT